MKIGIFSDLHGNQHALRSFVGMLPELRLDRLIFCGDIFGYYYGQCEIIECLSNLRNLTWLLGNHDKYYLDLLDGRADAENLCEKYGNSYRLALSYASETRSKLQLLSSSAKLNLCGKSIVAVHGTYDDSLEGRLYPKDIGKYTANTYCEILIMGHTHFRMFEEVHGTLLINSGSLGQPRDKNQAGVAILTLPECTVEFVDVIYDRASLKSEIQVNDPGNKKLIELLDRIK